MRQIAHLYRAGCASFLPKQAFYIDAFIAVFELDVNKIDGPGKRLAANQHSRDFGKR